MSVWWLFCAFIALSCEICYLLVLWWILQKYWSRIWMSGLNESCRSSRYEFVGANGLQIGVRTRKILPKQESRAQQWIVSDGNFREFSGFARFSGFWDFSQYFRVLYCIYPLCLYICPFLDQLDTSLFTSFLHLFIFFSLRLRILLLS